jgi:hypothetical protein
LNWCADPVLIAADPVFFFLQPLEH